MKRPDTLPTRFFLGASLLFALTCGWAVWIQKTEWLLPAVALLFLLYLLRSPSLLFLLLIFSIPWSIEWEVTTSLSTDWPDESLMLLLSLSILLHLIYRRPNPLYILISPFVLGIGLQLLWTVVTVVFSIDPILSLKYLLAKGWYLLAFLVAPVLLFARESEIKKGALLLAGSMLAAVIYVLIRHAGYGFTFDSINASVSPFFRNHVNYSALLVCVLPIVAGVWAASASIRAKRGLAAAGIVLLAGLYFSYARGAWLALVIGAIAYWLLKKRRLVQAYVLAVIITLLVFGWLTNENRYTRFAPDYHTTIFHPDFRDHLVATYQFKDVSTAERFYRWIAAVRMSTERWQTGFGPNTFYPAYKSYTVPAFKTWVSQNPERSTVHNYFLLMLVEQGIIGLLLFLMLIGYAFFTAQRVYLETKDRFWRITVSVAAVVLAMIVTVNFLSDLIETDKVGSVFYLCQATLVVADLKRRESLHLSPDVERIP